MKPGLESQREHGFYGLLFLCLKPGSHEMRHALRVEASLCPGWPSKLETWPRVAAALHPLERRASRVWFLQWALRA